MINKCFLFEGLTSFLVVNNKTDPNAIFSLKKVAPGLHVYLHLTNELEKKRKDQIYLQMSCLMTVNAFIASFFACI